MRSYTWRYTLWIPKGTLIDANLDSNSECKKMRRSDYPTGGKMVKGLSCFWSFKASKTENERTLIKNPVKYVVKLLNIYAKILGIVIH